MRARNVAARWPFRDTAHASQAPSQLDIGAGAAAVASVAYKYHNLLFVVSDTGINPGRGLFYCDDINPVGIAPSLRPVGSVPPEINWFDT